MPNNDVIPGPCPKSPAGTDIIVFDQERVRMVFEILIRAWQNKERGLSEFIEPEQNFRPACIVEGSRKHALYLFFAAWISRSGKRADDVIRVAGEIARDHFAIIDPSVPLPDNHREILRNAVAFNEEIRIDQWLRCRYLLHDRWRDDPLNIFLGLDFSRDQPSNEELLEARQRLVKRLCRFDGIQHKIAQLAITWFQQAQWPDNHAEWERIRQVPSIAVDVWVMRLIRQFNLVSEWSTDNREFLSKQISDFIARFCLEHQMSIGDLSQCLWHVGARICATMQKRPVVKRRVYCHSHCPAYSICVGFVPADEKRALVRIKTGKRPPKPKPEERETTRREIGWGNIILHEKHHRDLRLDPGEVESGFHLKRLIEDVPQAGSLSAEKSGKRTPGIPHTPLFELEETEPESVDQQDKEEVREE